MALKKPTGSVQKILDALPLWEDQEFKHDYPDLFSFLCDTKYEDGTARIPGTVSLFVRNGVLSAALNDNDNKLATFVNARTFAELMFGMDQAVCAEATEWKARQGFGTDKKVPF